MADGCTSGINGTERPIQFISWMRAACEGREVLRLALPTVALWSGMVGATVPLKAQADRQTGEQRANAAEARHAATALESDHPIARSLVLGDTHLYQITLGTHQYSRVVLEPQELDLKLSVEDPDGHPVVQKISPYGPQGPVDAFLVAGIAGTYTVAVSATENNANPGRYQIRIAAIRTATTSDELCGKADQTIGQAQQLRDKATAESRRTAIGRYEQALGLLRIAGDRGREAQAIELLASLHNDLGENKKASELFKRSLQLFQALHDRRGEAMALSDLGSVENDLGHNKQALTDLTEARSIRKEIGDLRGEAETLEYLGDLYENTSETVKALETYNSALALRKKIGDLRGEAESLKDIGVTYYDIDEEQTALEYYNKALPIQHAVHDLWDEALTLNSIGAVYDSLGEKKKALEYFERSLPLKRAVGNRQGEAHTLGNMCSSEQTLGDWQNAIDHCRAALAISREIGDRQEQAASLTKLGLLYMVLGEQELALKQFQRSLVLARATNWPAWEATNLNSIAQVLHEQKNYDKALANYNLALTIRHKIRDRTGEAATLYNIGRLRQAQGKDLIALHHFNQALVAARAAGSKQWEATSLNGIGLLYASKQQNQESLENLNDALEIYRNLGDPRGEASVLFGRARVERDLGELLTALGDIESALKIIETLRTKVTSQQLRTSYFASVREYYDFYIDLLMELSKLHPSDGYDAKALMANERSKARSLLESLGEARAEIRTGVDQELLDREQTLEQLLDGKVARRMRLLSAKHTEEQAAAAKAEVERLLGEYEVVEAEVREKSPRYAALTQAEPLTVEKIQKEVLDADTILLEYALGEQRSYLWAVTPNSFSAYELPKRTEIEKVAKLVYGLAKTRSQRRSGQHNGPRTDYSESVTSLSRMLMTPVVPFLKGKRLLIVSDGAVQYVPFGILPEPEESPQRNLSETQRTPLVVGHEIVNLPSASTLAALRLQLKSRSAAPRAVAVLADPVFDKNDSRVANAATGVPTHDQPPKASHHVSEPSLDSLANARRTRSATEAGLTRGLVFPRLAFSRREAEAILADVPAEDKMEALDFEASQSTATSEQLSQFRIVHFATHGWLDTQDPELSSLVLSLVDKDGKPQNGYLQLRNIYNLKLSADLVVLSGCETVLGKEVKGEGLLGLTRGFMYAGAPRVVASLWSVDDTATAELMGRFYKGMLRSSLRPTAALQQAQVEMWHQKRWSNPYYWAAFSIQGEWK